MSADGSWVNIGECYVDSISRMSQTVLFWHNGMGKKRKGLKVLPTMGQKKNRADGWWLQREQFNIPVISEFSLIRIPPREVHQFCFTCFFRYNSRLRCWFAGCALNQSISPWFNAVDVPTLFLAPSSFCEELDDVLEWSWSYAHCFANRIRVTTTWMCVKMVYVCFYTNGTCGLPGFHWLVVYLDAHVLFFPFESHHDKI